MQLVSSSEAQQQCDGRAQYKGSEEEPFGDRKTGQAQYQKGNRDKDSRRFRIHAHHSKGAGMPLGVVILHGVIFAPVRPKSDPARLGMATRLALVTLRLDVQRARCLFLSQCGQYPIAGTSAVRHLF